MNNFKISASSPEEFIELEKAVSVLPGRVTNQIAVVEHSLVGVTCTFKDTFSSETKTFLPNNTTQIKDFDDYIGAYSGDFFFKINKKNGEGFKYDFLFLPLNDE